jgi:tRNA threonylcarbamoyl adenosine modification protein (Sua5/YciO/YrdC/YwlC family)
MSQFFRIHPTHPQARLIQQAVVVIDAGGVVAYPTDSSYALGCRMGQVPAMERIRRIRRVDADHNFTLVCRDLSELSTYARVDNATYRLLRAHTPGPYTFLLRATREVPRRLQHPKRNTIGLRVPDAPIVRALLDALGEPLMSVTLILPGDELPLTDAEEIRDRIGGLLDLVIDGGPCGAEPTSVVDLSGSEHRILRHGRGDVSAFETLPEQ